MMIDYDNDGQMIFGNLGGLKLPNICLTDEEKPRENLTQETCPDRGSNPDPLRDRHARYCLAHSGGHFPLPAVQEVCDGSSVTPCIVMKNDGVLYHQVSSFSPESM